MFSLTIMRGLLFNCSSLKNINISIFNAINIKDMNSMLTSCNSLEKINLSMILFYGLR